MRSLFSLLVVSTMIALTPGTASSKPPRQAQDALLVYVAPLSSLAGISHGMTAVDAKPLFLDQRVNTKVASGVRTVWYSCPNEPAMQGGSHLSFDFKADQVYELVCRAGQQAEIRTGGC